MLSPQRSIEFDQSSFTSAAESWATAPSTPAISRAGSLSRTHSAESHNSSRITTVYESNRKQLGPSRNRRPNTATSDTPDGEGTAWAKPPPTDQYVARPLDETRLPSRSLRMATAASHSTVNTPPDSPREPARRLLATASMQHLSSTSDAMSYASVRSRSGSMASSVNARRRATASEGRDITIAVIGAAGVGKSTFIRKGAKHYNLDPKPVDIIAPRGFLGSRGPVVCSRRVGRVDEIIIDDEVFPFARILHILEVDIDSLKLESDIKSQLPPLATGFAGPQVDGVMICYDASSTSSFVYIESLVRRIAARGISFMVLALKSDLPEIISEQETYSMVKKYDAGLVVASSKDPLKKDAMYKSFTYITKAIFRKRRGTMDINQPPYGNPASPSVITNHVASALTRSRNGSAASLERKTPASSVLSSPTSPSKKRSMPDTPVSAGEKSARPSTSTIATTLNNIGTTSEEISPTNTEVAEPGPGPEPRPQAIKTDRKSSANFATVSELTDRLLWVAVTNDDPAFLDNFLLTYRRFMTPRTIILAMIKRVSELETKQGDIMFRAFCQMRTCHLLETWMKEYPGDFVVRGAPEALNGFVNMVRRRTHLIHYAGFFIPELENLSTRKDEDAAWALPESAYSEHDDDIVDDLVHDLELGAPAPRLRASTVDEQPPQDRILPMTNPRERSGSLPATMRIPSLHHARITRSLIQRLQKLASDINGLNSVAIAQEITRHESFHFMAIQPRHWLHYAFVSGKREREKDTVTQFNVISNNLASLVSSVILAHDKPKGRARQIEKFVEIAMELRLHSNYSALRAVVAGINNAVPPEDEAMTLFKAKSEKLSKTWKSWDLLLDSSRSHRLYRLALRHTEHPCIPALEVHMSDLLRAQEGNADRDGERIHWGKFNMMGKFVTTTSQCQSRISRASHNSPYSKEQAIEKFINQCIFGNNDLIMVTELQEQRIAYSTTYEEELVHPPMFHGISREVLSPSKADGTRFKKLFTRENLK